MDSTLWRVVLPPRQILQFYVYAQDFHPGGLWKWKEPQESLLFGQGIFFLKLLLFFFFYFQAIFTKLFELI